MPHPDAGAIGQCEVEISDLARRGVEGGVEAEELAVVGVGEVDWRPGDKVEVDEDGLGKRGTEEEHDRGGKQDVHGGCCDHGGGGAVCCWWRVCLVPPR